LYKNSDRFTKNNDNTKNKEKKHRFFETNRTEPATNPQKIAKNSDKERTEASREIKR
jgi:hypothetical protein